jgi:hypothetical protein
MSDDEVTEEHRYGPAVQPPGVSEIEDKLYQDFRLRRKLIMDMLDDNAYHYEEKKDKMITSMTNVVKGMSDLWIKKTLADSYIFPIILKDFSDVLYNELEERRKNDISK